MTDSKEKKIHAEKIFTEVLQRDYYAQFQGVDPVRNIFVLPEEGRSATSSAVQIQIVTDLTKAGVKGNDDLSTNYDELDFLPFTIEGELYAKPLRSPVKIIMDRTTADSWRRTKKSALVQWNTQNNVRLKTYAICKDFTHVVCVKSDGSIVATPAELAEGDVLGIEAVEEALQRAEDGYENADGKKFPKLHPYTIEKATVGGIEVIGEYYPFFVGSASWRNIQNDPAYIAYQETKAQSGDFSGVRGFKGEYKGAVFIRIGRDDGRTAGGLTSSSPAFDKFSNMSGYIGGGDAQTELNFLLGCGAVGVAFDTGPEYDEFDKSDDGRKVVAYTQQFLGVKKVRFVGESPAEMASIYHDIDAGTIGVIATIK